MINNENLSLSLLSLSIEWGCLFIYLSHKQYIIKIQKHFPSFAQQWYCKIHCFLSESNVLSLGLVLFFLNHNFLMQESYVYFFFLHIIEIYISRQKW